MEYGFILYFVLSILLLSLLWTKRSKLLYHSGRSHHADTNSARQQDPEHRQQQQQDGAQSAGGGGSSAKSSYSNAFQVPVGEKYTDRQTKGPLADIFCT